MLVRGDPAALHEIFVAPRAGDGPHATANCVCVCASSCLCVCKRLKSARKSCLPWSDQRSDSTSFICKLPRW